MVKYIKPKPPTRREIRVAERDAKRARRVGLTGLRSPRPKSPTLSRSSSFRASLNALDGNISPILIVRSPSPGGSPKRGGRWSRPGSPVDYRSDNRPVEALQLMANCIQYCNDNLEQMKQVNQRLELLRDRSPSPSLSASPDWKRRNQLMRKKIGGITPPLSPSGSFGLLQTSSVLVDGERSLLSSTMVQSSQSGAVGNHEDSDTSTGKVASSVMSPVSKEISVNPPSNGAERQQPTLSTTRVALSRSSDAHEPGHAVRGVGPSQRLAPRRQSSSSSLSSNAAAVRLAGAASVTLNSVPVAKSTKQSYSTTRSPSVSSKEEPRGRTVSGSSSGDPRPWIGRVPPPARTVAGARVTAPRPAPVRSSSVLGTNATVRPESPFGARSDAARTTVSATARKAATVPRSRTPSNSSVPGVPGPGNGANTPSSRLSRASPLSAPRVSGSCVQPIQCAQLSNPARVSSNAALGPTGPVNTPPSHASAQSTSRPPSGSRQPSLSAASERPRTASGPSRASDGVTTQSHPNTGPSRTGHPSARPLVSRRLRTTTGPQILVSPAEDTNYPRPSVAPVRVSPVAGIASSASRMPPTGPGSSSVTAADRVRKASGPARTALDAGKDVISNRDGLSDRRPRQLSGVTGTLDEAPSGNASARGRAAQATLPSPVRNNVKSAAHGSDSTGTQRMPSLRSPRLRSPIRALESQSMNSRPIPILTLDCSGSLPRQTGDASSRASTRRRASRPYHTQAQNRAGIANPTTLPSSEARRDGSAPAVLPVRNASVLSGASTSVGVPRNPAVTVPATTRNVDTFDVEEIKACLFGHTVLTGPPRAYSAALRLWLKLLPGLSALFKLNGLSIAVDLDAKPQVFAVRRPKVVSPMSRREVVAFLQSRPIPLVVSRRFSNISVERCKVDVMPSPEPPHGAWPHVAAPHSAPRSLVQAWQKPAMVKDVFLPGGPFEEVTEEEAMLIPPPGMQKPRKQSLRRTLNRMSRLSTPTRMPHLIRPLIGGSKMDAYLAALEAQTFDMNGGPGNALGELGRGHHARRVLIRMLKTACRAACRNATKLVLSPWRLLLRVLLRQ